MGVRVLVIDDSAVDRELARRALARLTVPPGPAEVVCAGDWPQAARHLETSAFDVLILDFHLPGVSGLDVLRVLETRPHPPVIMMTGQDDVATAVETLRAGAYDYVPKSVDAGPTLCLTVERALERVRLERELAESRARLAAYAAELEQKVAARTAMVRAQAAEIEALYLKAEEASRLKAEIVANVSHELRTPLNIIIGYTDLLDESIAPETNPDLHHVLAKVRRQGKRLDALIESLLALGRLKTGGEGFTRSRFTLAALVEELRGDAAVLGPDPELLLDWKAPPEPYEVEHDREKIRTIAYHLLSNAIKFTPAGRVVVSIAGTSAGEIVIAVSDSGIGVPPEAREIIFDDFRQLDGSSTRRYEGLGLGLGIVKRYVGLLRGAVDLESTPGEGTTITVRVPPLAPAGPGISPPDAPPSR
jgi:signal transduction histidine kinase